MSTPLALPDPTTEAGARLAERLDTELIAWLTTVNAAGQPQSSAVWFVWAEGELLMYSRLGAPRSRNIAANPHVSVHLNSDPEGDDIVTFEAQARLDPAAPPASAVPAFLAKYGRLIANYGWSAEQFVADYPDAIRIRPTRLRLG